MKMIVVVARDWGIGCEGYLLFKLPKDMEFFKNATKNHIVVMGRKTLDSLPGGKSLKNRVNVVLTSDVNFKREGCIICNSVEKLLQGLKKYDLEDVYVIGGSKIFDELRDYCKEAYITKVDTIVAADTYLHNFDEDENWKLDYQSEDNFDNGFKFTFNTYKNVNVKTID